MGSPNSFPLILQFGANNLSAVEQIFRTDKADHSSGRSFAAWPHRVGRPYRNARYCLHIFLKEVPVKQEGLALNRLGTDNLFEKGSVPQSLCSAHALKIRATPSAPGSAKPSRERAPR